MPGVANSNNPNRSKAQREDHFWATPHAATEALLAAVGRHIPHYVWEPSCGEGHISKVLELHGFNVVSTDLIDRGYGEHGVDMLTTVPMRNAVITNPPFKHAAHFIDRMSHYEPVFMALLLKSTYWHAAERTALYERYKPKLTLPLTWRLDFTGEGKPTMECTWFVWGQFIDEARAPRPLPKPVDTLSEMML